MKRNYISTPTPATSSVTVTNNTKTTTMWNDEDNDNGVDELLAMLGYKVKSTDMYDVAQKIEHLEGVFQNDDGLSQIASDSVHYNPSDLNSWLESMICELNPDPVTDLVSVRDNFVIDNDLQVIAGNAVYPPSKKLKPNFSSSSSSSSDSPSASASVSNTSSFHPNPNPNLNQIQNRSQISVSDASSFHPNPNLNQNLNQHENRKQIHNQNHQNQNQNNQVVIVDSQENGIRLVHTLMACAEAVQQNNYQLAENLVKQAGMLAVSQAGAMRKVATCFAEALARRIYRLSPESVDSPAFSDLLQMHFYETCPYLKFAHFTANQAILEAFAGKKKVHVIDFGLKQGMQWPALMQALALRPGGPPAFRLTGIGPPSGDNTDRLQEVGWKLAQLADTINVEFEFRGFIAGSLADLEPSMFDLRSDEVLAVNSVFELHQLLARSGAIEKVLSTVKMMKPEIVTVVEQEANHNGLNFLERFTESLHYYSTLFDSLESSGTGGVSGGGGGGGSGVGGSGVGGLAPVSDESKIMSEVYLGKQICNVVACEGTDRVERHETLTQWKTRFDSAGFEPVHLGSNAFKQASMLLALFAGGDGYRVEEDDGCLMLGWHTRPLIATSAWKIK